MYLLNDLWYGNVNPSERYACRGSEYKKVTAEAAEGMDRLMAELTPKKPSTLLHPAASSC